MMRDLLLDLFRKLYQQPVSGNSLMVTLKYVSIHPYNDYNGRTCRFLDWLATIGSSNVEKTFISDLDLVTPSSLYKKFVDVSRI